MTWQESVGSAHDWVEDATVHVDVVASWESLCDTYDALRFTDRLSDEERLEEFKWIVQQMNAFLTKMRTKLLTCRDKEAMVELMASSMTPAGKVELGTRKALVYQKLRQQWLKTGVTRLGTMIEMEEELGNGLSE